MRDKNVPWNSPKRINPIDQGCEERATLGIELLIVANGIPEEMIVNLCGSDQVIELFDSRESAMAKYFRGHVDPAEKFVELTGSPFCIPCTLKVG